jgi:tripartite-type tricarboxylate transporter receptor subunit TctC
VRCLSVIWFVGYPAQPFLTLLAVLGLGLATIETAAEIWPTKPLRAIVPVGAGSTTDIIPRVVFEQLALQLGQSIVVENRPGAGGTIGSAYVAKSEPDGYTILAHGGALTISPSLFSNLSFDPVRDFAPVVPFGMSSSVLVVPPARGWNTAGDRSQPLRPSRAH